MNGRLIKSGSEPFILIIGSLVDTSHQSIMESVWKVSWLIIQSIDPLHLVGALYEPPWPIPIIIH